MALKAKPPHNPGEIKNMLSSTMGIAGGGEPDTPDAGGFPIHTHRAFDNDDPPQPTAPLQHGVQVNPLDHPGSNGANRSLADAIQNLFRFGGTVTDNAGNQVAYVPKNNGNKFLLTWRMYAQKNVSTGACGCGCGCG
jgi:hypothetical protein